MFLTRTPISAQQKGNLKITDTAKKNVKKDTVYYPIKDRRGDYLSQPSNNPFDLRDTSIVKKISSMIR